MSTQQIISTELENRRLARKSLTDAQKQLQDTLRAWVQDTTPDYQRFTAAGHRGEYDEIPKDTLARKLSELGWTEEAIAETMRKRVTALDYMSSVELLFVYRRIMKMLVWFSRNPHGGKFTDAMRMYQHYGAMIRYAILEQYGIYPNDFPTPAVAITGKEDSFSASELEQSALFLEAQEDDTW